MCMCILYTIWSLCAIMGSHFQQFSDYGSQCFFFIGLPINKFEANLQTKVINKCRDKYAICSVNVVEWEYENGKMEILK